MKKIISTLIVFSMYITSFAQNGTWQLKGEVANKFSTSIVEIFEDSLQNIHFRPIIGLEEYPIFRKNEKWSNSFDREKFQIEENELIYKIIIDSEERIWALTNKGILLCDEAQGNKRFLEDFDFDEMKKFNKPFFYNGFVVTNKVIFFYDNKSFKLIKDFDRKNQIYFATIQDNKRIWLCTNKGLIKCEKGRCDIYLEGIDLSGNLIKKFKDLQNGYFVHENIIYYYSNTIIPVFTPDKKEEVLSSSIDKSNQLWIMTNKRLLKYCSGDLTVVANDFSLKKNERIRKIEILKSDIIWIFSNKNTYVLNNNNLIVFNDDYYLSHTNITFPLKENAIMHIGSSYYYEINGNMKKFTSDQRLISPKLIIREDFNVAWVKDKNSIGYIENETFKKIDFKNVNSGYNFFDIVFVSDSEFYVARNISNNTQPTNTIAEPGGFLIHWKQGIIKYYKGKNKISALKNMYINELLIDSFNNLWITTGLPKDIRPNSTLLEGQTALIIKISGNNIEIFDKHSGFNEMRAYRNIFEDNQKRIWIFSENEGVYMYKYNE